MKLSSDPVGPRSVHRKALLNALADQLPINSIRFSSKLTAIETQEHEGSSISIIHMADGTVIKAKVNINQHALFYKYFNFDGMDFNFSIPLFFFPSNWIVIGYRF